MTTTRNTELTITSITDRCKFIVVNAKGSTAVEHVHVFTNPGHARVYVTWTSDPTAKWAYDVHDVAALLTAGTAGQIANYAKRNAAKAEVTHRT